MQHVVNLWKLTGSFSMVRTVLKTTIKLKLKGNIVCVILGQTNDSSSPICCLQQWKVVTALEGQHMMGHI